jgi:hypothetical protein
MRRSCWECNCGSRPCCSVCARAAETVPATFVSIDPVSIVEAKMGVGGVDESPGRTQAMVTKNIREMKNVRVLFMTSSLTCEIKKASRQL